jgi:hypothetical protein
MNFTKQTVVEWLSKDDMMGDQQLNTERKQILNKMTTEKKTDGEVVVDEENFIGKIKFVDQDSAEEYIQYLNELATKHNKIIKTTQIVSPDQ